MFIIKQSIQWLIQVNNPILQMLFIKMIKFMEA